MIGGAWSEEREQEIQKAFEGRSQAYDQKTVGAAGSHIPDVLGNALNSARRIPLREQLEKQAAERHLLHDKAARAVKILTEHPEFELFLELQELINSGLFR